MSLEARHLVAVDADGAVRAVGGFPPEPVVQALHGHRIAIDVQFALLVDVDRYRRRVRSGAFEAHLRGRQHHGQLLRWLVAHRLFERRRHYEEH